MSTGDSTQYIRRKLEERKHTTNKSMRFMRDGFDQWAESNTPARQGQIEKVAAPVMAPQGEMSVAKAKQLLSKVGNKMMDADYTSQGPDGMEGSGMRIGGAISIATITNAYNDIRAFWSQANTMLDEIIRVTANPPEEVPNFAVQWLQELSGDLADIRDGLRSVGLGKKRGGAVSLANIGGQVISAFNFLRDNRADITSVLNNETVNQAITLPAPIGQLPRRILWLLSYIPFLGYARPEGMGRRNKCCSACKMKGKKSCCCMKGSAKLGSVDESRVANISVEDVGRGGFNFLDKVNRAMSGPMTAKGRRCGSAAPMDIGALVKKMDSKGRDSPMRRVDDASVRGVQHVTQPGVGSMSMMKVPMRAGGRAPLRQKVSELHSSEIEEAARVREEGRRAAMGESGMQGGFNFMDKVKRAMSGGKKSSPWIAHVKAFASKHGVSYKQALSQAGASYRK